MAERHRFPRAGLALERCVVRDVELVGGSLGPGVHRVRVLLSVLALLALVVGGLAGFWWLGGPDAHRWVARRTLEFVLEREVHVDGTLELELGAEPLVQLTGVRIDSPSWAETPNQLQIARAQIQIALRPLLRRVLVFPLIDLEGMTIALETAADGRHSWQSDHGEAWAPPRETRFAIPLFDRLSVKDATSPTTTGGTAGARDCTSGA